MNVVPGSLDAPYPSHDGSRDLAVRSAADFDQLRDTGVRVVLTDDFSIGSKFDVGSVKSPCLGNEPWTLRRSAPTTTPTL
jgi:hypothetical protein